MLQCYALCSPIAGCSGSCVCMCGYRATKIKIEVHATLAFWSLSPSLLSSSSSPFSLLKKTIIITTLIAKHTQTRIGSACSGIMGTRVLGRLHRAIFFRFNRHSQLVRIPRRPLKLQCSRQFFFRAVATAAAVIVVGFALIFVSLFRSALHSYARRFYCCILVLHSFFFCCSYDVL